MRYLLTIGFLLSSACSLLAQELAADCIVAADDYSACDTCEMCESCCTSERGKLLGFIAPTSLCHSDYISPMTNPVFFEDPRTLSEIRFIAAHHQVPGTAPLAGGRINLVAAQIRAALTDRLSIVAAKDGYFWMSNDLPFAANDGWADIAAGLKYNLWIADNYDAILSGGLSYELPVGSTQTLQGNGDGEFNLYGSYGMRVGDRSHFLTAAGFRLPVDSSAESQMFYWSGHLDRQICGSNFYVFGEANWYHYMSSGTAIPGLPVGGLDLFNFGAGDVAGNDIVTCALGAKYKPTLWQEIGFAAEAPVTSREDVLDFRLTADWIIRY